MRVIPSPPAIALYEASTICSSVNFDFFIVTAIEATACATLARRVRIVRTDPPGKRAHARACRARRSIFLAATSVSNRPRWSHSLIR